RVKLLKPQRVFDVLTQYRGRLLTTITRIDLHDIPESDWQDITYSKEIDTLVADIAMHDESAQVRAFAGRVIGRMRSKTAVRYLTEG
ncbi:hypothetical protein, partial [Enterococcus casseliflavus]|uniref:hypothetical protein n=1 Tax=Enterococcus casseliflavus TaxID=37734 RepID=UPI003D150017